MKRIDQFATTPTIDLLQALPLALFGLGVDVFWRTFGVMEWTFRNYSTPVPLLAFEDLAFEDLAFEVAA